MRELTFILAEFVDRQNWLIQQFLAYLSQKGLLEDYASWQAEENKKNKEA